MFGAFLRRTIIHNYDDTIEYLHATEHVKIYVYIIYTSIPLTTKRGKIVQFTRGCVGYIFT